MRRLVFAGAFALVPVAAFLLGMATRPGGVVGGGAPLAGGPEVTARAPSGRRTSRPAEGCPEDLAVARRIEELEARQRDLAEALERTGPAAAAEVGRLPMPFPKGVGAARRADRFLDSARSALEGCFPGLRVTDADCSEYPCIAWATTNGPGPALDLAGCEPWARHMGDRSVVYRFTAPDGAGNFLGIATTRGRGSPGDAPYDRTQARMADLAEAYGARGP